MAMISGRAGEVERKIEALWTSGTLTGLSDAQLLGRFADARGRDAFAEAAFRELVNRHGPMVLGVCRQILGNRHDVEDTFQSTFLVLVRKARSIRVGESLAPWLCGVAYRTAQRARAAAARFHQAAVDQIEDSSTAASNAAYHFDLRPLLHDELNRLPAKFRDPIVLCHLEGKSHEEAARLLHWPVGTVSSRLSRGRQLLRSRLQRRGLDVAPAMFAANWFTGTPNTLTVPLLESTVTSATGFAAGQAVPTLILSLTQGVLTTMWLHKLRTISLAFLLIGAATGGLGAWAHWTSTATRRPVQASGLAPLPTPENGVSPARDSGSAPQPAQQPATSQPSDSDARLADCPGGCDDEYPYCPITMATNAFRGLVSHFHQSSSPSR
jgi:RNA polymerase sigma factor (sigma-70 family)